MMNVACDNNITTGRIALFVSVRPSICLSVCLPIRPVRAPNSKKKRTTQMCTKVPKAGVTGVSFSV